MDLERKLARKIQRTIENCYQHFNVFIKLEIFLYDKKPKTSFIFCCQKLVQKRLRFFAMLKMSKLP